MESISPVEKKGPAVPLGRCTSAAALARQLHDAIASGAVKPGQQLPSLNTLVQETGLSYKTVHRAIEQLRREGLVETRQGKGSFVTGGGEREKAVGPLRIGVAPPYWGGSARHYVFGAVLHGITEEATRHRHRIEICRIAREALWEWRSAEEILKSGLDGLICIQPPSGPIPMFYRLCDAGFPLVLTGRGYIGLPAPAVHDDPEVMARLIADWMEERGRKHLAALVGHPDDLHTRPRVDALRHVLPARGLGFAPEDILTVYFGGTTIPYLPNREKTALDFLQARPHVDALFSLPLEYLKAAVDLHHLGERTCPRDFSLIHLEQSPEPARQAFPELPISLIIPPFEAIGRQALRELERARGLAPPGDDMDLRPTINVAP